MSRTPDRFPGVREDEGILLPPQATAPTAEGEIRNVTGQGLRFFTGGSATGIATTAYADAVEGTGSWKNAVRAASTGTLTLSGTQTVDGVSLVAGERVLVKDQSTGSQNGIYVVASGAWTRATDANTSAKVKAGTFVYVCEGTSNADKMFALTTNDPITLDTTSLSFQEKGAGGGGGGSSVLAAYSFVPDAFDTPDTSAWAISVGAQSGTDPSVSAIKVRGFDATTEEGVGFALYVPATATNLTLRCKARALSTPGSPQTVRIKLYHRRIPDNAAIPAWSSYNGWANIDIPANGNYQYDTETVSLATLGVTAGNLYLFELTRDAANVSDTLTGDWGLAHMEVEFT